MFHSQKWVSQLQTYFSIHGNAVVSELILESRMLRNSLVRFKRGSPLREILFMNAERDLP